MIYKQQRIGKNGVPFVIYKIRTMENKKIIKGRKWLRISQIDELPQLWNILKGDMTLVGPRPLIPKEDYKYRTYNLPIKPGITGLWQINGCQKKDLLKWDTAYFKNKSFLYDCYILLITVPYIWRRIWKH